MLDTHPAYASKDKYASRRPARWAHSAAVIFKNTGLGTRAPCQQNEGSPKSNLGTREVSQISFWWFNKTLPSGKM